MDYSKRACEVIDIEIAGLRRTRKTLLKGFDRTVGIILETLAGGGKIVLTGVGKNYHVAQKISATLVSTGSSSVILNPMQAMHGDVGLLSRNDVLLVVSYSGESEEILALIPVAKRAGLRIIALTGQPDSSLAKLSDAVLSAAVDREACPFNMAPTASTTAAMAVGDALAMVLLEARGFKKEDYAKFHPGGSIGRTLLLRVSDIMRKGDRMAVVSKGSAVREAVLAMTSARSGSAAVVDSKGRLAGIITDGDLRRHMAGNGNLVGKRVEEVMTRSPVTISSKQLAVDVLKLFEEKNIDDILVVDGRNHVVGAIDIQDLPKLKIM